MRCEADIMLSARVCWEVQCAGSSPDQRPPLAIQPHRRWGSSSSPGWCVMHTATAAHVDSGMYSWDDCRHNALGLPPHQRVVVEREGWADRASG